MSEPITVTLTETSTEQEVEQIVNELTKALNSLNNKNDEYHANGENVGWRDENGSTTVTLTDGRDLLQKLLPDGPSTAEITITDEQISFELSHHDSPTGETHTITAPPSLR